ncbi:MAG: nicotinate phosphoribosyltransferase [Candidatus Obscuribacterales bacterium]|nr:nicotinate phosphoribosyltransferase [Candidatus Obscuribacterales bacterium]
MSTLTDLYSSSLALLTDLYQLTMGYSYWKSGTADKEAVFHLFFRKAPFGNAFTVACGLRYTIDFLQNFRITESDTKYLSTLRGADQNPLFSDEFLQHLGELRFQCNVDAVPEGTIVFPQEPMLRISGSLLECQLLETALLNLWNFQTLIATKSIRIREAAGSAKVVEFGARRAQGPDGALTASYAAYIGGCDSTSNVLAGKLFGIPVTGTHAHSWVMSFEDERTAYDTYAKCMPNNCIFLVDTYDTLEGVRHAIETGLRLRSEGHEMQGIRLDSGDLAYLSIEARKLLDEGGFPDAVIVATNDLDESIISSLKLQGARIDVWGVGTKLITGYDQPALGGVYKLAAIRNPGDKWTYKIKLSEQSIKVSTPGLQQIRRFMADGLYIGDAIYDLENAPDAVYTIVDPFDMTRRKKMVADSSTDLLVPIFRRGKLVYTMPDNETIKASVYDQLTKFHPSIRRLLNPHEYPVGLELSLQQLKTDLILKARGFS